MNKKITIDDVANALGVSKTTVSRAISGKGRIGAATKARVMAYIEENNYKPNVIAKGLAKQRTFNIAVVWPGDYEVVDLPFFQKCMLGMSETTSENDYDIIISMVKGDDVRQLARIIDNHKVDGVILTRTLVHDAPADYLKRQNIPFVAIGTSEDKSIVQVDNNHFEACRELTETLIQKGMKRIALIGGRENHVITATRYRGYEEAFNSMKAPLDNSLVYMNVDTEAKTARILEELRSKNVDCIICMDDSICSYVIKECRDKGIKIPQDMKLASFYNSTVLENANPSITSLNFDDIGLGKMAAQTLLDIIDGKKISHNFAMGYEVILKVSTK